MIYWCVANKEDLLADGNVLWEVVVLFRPQVRPVVPLLAALLVASFANPQYVTILHFNDLHGQLLPLQVPDHGELGGIARMATMVADTRAWNDPHGVDTLLLQAGDILQGTPLSTVFQGEPDFKCLNLMGIDVMTIGNHEFDFGQDNLHARIRQARFPIISANIRHADTGALLAPPLIQTEIGGVKTLIFGLTSADTPIESLAKNVVGLEFLDPVAVAREIVTAQRAKFPIIIALTHIGLQEDIKLAKAVPGIDIIIGAHSHDALSEPLRVGDTLICQAGSKGLYLGQLDAYFVDGNIARYRGFLRQVDGTVRADPVIEHLVRHYAEQLTDKLKRVVATSTVPLNGTRDELRSGETNLGNLLADILRDFAAADVAFINGGGIRNSIDVGPITVEEVMLALPFDNQLATVEVTGEVLFEVLQHDARLPRPDGGFLQISGITLRIKGSEVVDAKVAGEPLAPTQTYKIALPDFLLTGGNGYTMFAKGNNPRFLGTTISAIVVNALQERGSVSPHVEGRITIEP
ncbi:MAG: bifunctional metallophosphatase/5'-nucleotidase [Candidatus Zipacnadales bacterium]